MNANTRNLNTRPRPKPASSDSLMNASFDLASLLLATWQFQDLREYASQAQDFVHRKQQDFEKRIDDHIAANALEGEDREEYYSSHEDDYDQLQSRFPRIVFSSTLLVACALFEGSLVDLCKGLERTLSVSQPWACTKHTGIRKAAAFLMENFGIDLSNYSHWDRVKDHFKVRDCIVHADGDLSNMQREQADRIRETAKRDGALDANGHLVIGHTFISGVIDDFEGIWPLLKTACIENDVAGPHYWP